jgi:hypothetical protein
MKSAVAALVLAAAVAAPALAQPRHTPMDRDLVIDGVGVACTGIGQTKADPHWLSYPVRIEFSNPRHEYLIGADVEVLSHGKPVVSVGCEGPWVLLKLAPGSYTVRAHLLEGAGRDATTTIRPPSHGQGRFVIVFPDA